MTNLTEANILSGKDRDQTDGYPALTRIVRNSFEGVVVDQIPETSVQDYNEIIKAIRTIITDSNFEPEVQSAALLTINEFLETADLPRTSLDVSNLIQILAGLLHEKGVNLYSLIMKQVEEITQDLEPIVIAALETEVEDGVIAADQTDAPAGKKRFGARARVLMLLASVLALPFTVAALCKPLSNIPQERSEIVQTMPPTPTTEESIERMSQHSGKLYYLRPGEGLDAVIWEVINKHNPDAYPINTGTADRKMTYDQAKQLLRLMNQNHNPIVGQSGGPENFSNPGVLATVKVPSWLSDPIYYGVYEPSSKNESYVIQPNETLDAIATKLGIVDKQAWYQQIQINNSPVTNINAIPSGGVITWRVVIPASYTP
jgi:hypothetical protein